MQLMKVAAKDIALWDVLGEGQEVWCKITADDEICVFFGGIDCWEKCDMFKANQLVNVLRRGPIPFVSSDNYARRGD